MVDEWWLYWRSRQNMRVALSSKKVMMVQVIVSKTHAPVMLPKNFICSNSFVVFALETFQCSFIMCTIHENWAWKYSSTMKTDRSYSIKDAFETFPFPQNISLQRQQDLQRIGEAYHEQRRQLMLDMQLGLTKTYNLFHSNAITAQAVNEKDKQVAALQKHLEKTPHTISFHEAIQGILKLRELHVQMDEAVLDAYGWNDIALRHDFYEVDYLPEKDRIRYTIHPDARKEVLKRLLELNHKIHEEEVKAGLWEKKKTSTKKSTIVNEPNAAYGGDLFNQE